MDDHDKSIKLVFESCAFDRFIFLSIKFALTINLVGCTIRKTLLILLLICTSSAAYAREANEHFEEKHTLSDWYYQQIQLLEKTGASGADDTSSQSVQTIQIEHYCGFFDEENPGSVFAFDSTQRIENVIDEIMAITGLPKNFEVIAAGVPNASAILSRNKRIIAYNQSFLRNVEKLSGTKWSAYSIMAHEIGHHLAGHLIGDTENRLQEELEADKFSGFALQRLGASVIEAQAVLKNMASAETASATHPAKRDRLAAIVNGWILECERDARCGPSGTIDLSSSTSEKGSLSPRPTEIKTITNQGNKTKRRAKTANIVGVSIINGTRTLQSNSDSNLILTGSKNTSTRKYSASAIRSLASSSGINWRYDPAIGSNVIVSADDNFHDALYPIIENGELSMNIDAKLLITENDIEVTWGGTAPENLEISGSTKLELVDINANHFNLTLSGASTVFVTGNVDSFKLHLSGSSNFEGVYFQSKDADMFVSGASRASLAVSISAKGEVTGASQVTLYGEPDTSGFSKGDAAQVRVVRR